MAPSLSRQGSQRPDSRASTTSAASQQQEAAGPASYMQQGPEAALLQYHASMRPQTSQQFEVHPVAPFGHHHSQSASFSGPAQFMAQDGALAQADFGVSHHRQASVPLSIGGLDGHDDKRRRGSAVTATNDKELREMLHRNEGRPLSEVAHEVIAKERTPFAEKTKQLFAMLWLRAVCKPAKTSVPRNRVYSQYATRCGTERVVPLNPASFGKLVRVIFPGIQTRRLGVRGESKYHYVDLAIEEESPTPYMHQAMNGSRFHPTETRPHRSDSSSTQQIDFSNIPRLQADTAAFPAADLTNFDSQISPTPAPMGPSSIARTFAHPDSRSMQPGTVDALTYPHQLRFALRQIPSFTENEPVNLPSIQPYLPPRTDADTAEALVALNRTHCTSLIDSIRFCKEKQFFRLFTSFHGTLTVPVQKLFAHPNIAPWIEQCDLVMYRTMVRFVSRLTLQAAPVIVINILSNISSNLHNHIVKTFSTLPPHVIEAKIRPATIFAGLLHRLIRVNQTAHAAANLLTIDQNREQMWREWVSFVNPKRVMEAELPDCGYQEVHNILTSEIRSLFEPLNASAYDDPYAFNSYHFEENGGFAQFLQNQNGSPGLRSGQSQVSAETVLDRWSAFIASLPGRFPNVPTRTLLHCISGVGTAALRDITIASGLSYGHWWVLKIFVDEMALWLAEMGGFLSPAPAEEIATVQVTSTNPSPILEHDGSRSHTAAPEAHDTIGSDPRVSGARNGPIHGQGTPNQPYRDHHVQQHQPHTQQQNHLHSQPPQPHVMARHEVDIDDSGIGMSMMDDDLTLSKYGVSAPHVAMHRMSQTVQSL